MLLPALLSLTFLSASPAATKPVDKPIFIAVGDQTGLKPFLASYRKGRFFKQPNKVKVLGHFRAGTTLEARSGEGGFVSLTVTKLDREPFPFSPTILVREAVGRSHTDIFPLVSVPPIDFLELSTVSAELTPQEIKLVQSKVLSIWEKERRLVPSDHWPPSPEISVRSTKAMYPEGYPNRLVITVSIAFYRTANLDNRGFFFFLMDRPKQTFLLSRFGHPEWFPNTPNSVVMIKPILFFKIGRVATPFILAEHEWGWESSGTTAIINLLNGNVEATTE